MLNNNGIKIGSLECYELTKASARIRVQLVKKETIVEFASGEEITVSLEYEKPLLLTTPKLKSQGDAPPT
ncbi:hypothetical protein Bca4012_072938 [Brassica carinata]